MTDYYEILGVSKDATKNEIKSAFRQMARKLHPDVNKEPDAEEKFKELGKAYETLMDDNKRATYDRYGEEGLNSAGFNSQGPFANGFGDLNDIFESFFGGFGFGGSRHVDPNAPQRGENLRLDIQIEFEEAVFGLEKEIKIDHLEQCETCHGTGAKAGSEPVTCPTCGGRGQVQQSTRTIIGNISQIITCPKCHGKGKIIADPCPDCNGEGRKEVEKKLSIKIPQGVDNGSKMRLSHEGDAGINGGPAGDLYVVIHVKPSEYYQRDNMDVYTECTITPAQAALGDSIEIKTLDGQRNITIPAGLQSGDKVKIKGAGVPSLANSSLRGDHIVVVTVQTPIRLSKDEKALYEKLFELQTGRKKEKPTVKEKIKGAFK
ncbi:MAG: molecular chaperone DnaJ [Candidatus Gastranaerophilales bacterium]|nr:molecular chaperone DnaJ [Candidatus Gastranaerophilales bacterium]